MINKKIKSLTKIFLRDYIEKLNIKNEKNKINLKSSALWSIIILAFCIMYISVYIISYLKRGNASVLFLKEYLPIVSIFMILQLIIVICNLFYYSKDLEYILPLPVKSIDILISKLLTVIIIMYFSEAVFLVIPLFVYWILVAGTLRFLIYSIFVLAIFPILYTLIISILTLIIMRLLKRIKNKNIIQVLTIVILTTILLISSIFILYNGMQKISNASEITLIEKDLDEINKYFILLHSIIKLLTEVNIIKNITNIFLIIFVDSILFFIFILLGRRLYFNNLIISKNKIKTKKQKNKYNINNKEISYLKKEIKEILKNTTYLTQTVFNYINIVSIALIILFFIVPMFIQEIQQGNYIQDIGVEQIKLQAFCTVLAIIQIISTFNFSALTAISKDGKQATFMKYIPISLYRQFIIKIIPSVILNIIMASLVLTVIFFQLKISFLYFIITLITSIIINIIYNIILLIIDCKKPNLNWTNIESVTKNNNNKIYQYTTSIIFILVIIYFAKVLTKCTFVSSIIIINIILIIILISINIYINRNIHKIFKKIY